MLPDTEGYLLSSKIDLGVHKQEDFCFDVGLDDTGTSLLINSKEQMLTEKLRSNLKFGATSTRYKDILDIYYLFDLIDRGRLIHCFTTLIFSNSGMSENTLDDIIRRVENTFSNKRYLDRLKGFQKNWLGMGSGIALTSIPDYLTSLK